MKVTEIKGKFSGEQFKAGIVVSRWNSLVTGRLKDGALEALQAHNIKPENITVTWCPGSYEIPLTARVLLNKGGFDAVICLGAIIRGSTPHFEYVAGAVNSGVSRLMDEFEVPVSFGILTTDTVEQAMERSGIKSGNKGEEAALAAIEMASVIRQIRQS